MKESIEKLIKLFPSNYEEMHASRPFWLEMKKQLPVAMRYMTELQNQSDDTNQLLLAKLSHNLGVFYTHVIENYPQALSLLELALETKEKINPIDIESVGLTHAQLADTAYRNSNFVLAIQHFNLANEAYQKKEGVRHCDLLRAFIFHASGNAYYNIGSYSKALEVFSEAEKIRAIYLPKDDIEFGYLEHDYADVLTALGHYEEAEIAFNSSFEKKIKHFKTEEHTNIAALYQCQALMYIKSRQFNKAKEKLELANSIYLSHSEQFSSEDNQPNLFRNYFYTILLYHYQENFEKTESEIKSFESQLELTINDLTHPFALRLIHEKTQLYQHQNDINKAIDQLRITLEKLIPELKFELAPKLLTDNLKFDVGNLLSQYGILLFIQNKYQNFENCLQILEIARQLKEEFYNALSLYEPLLGMVNAAFSDYDYGVIYYLSAITALNEEIIRNKLNIAANYFNEAKTKLLNINVSKNHNNVIACSIQLEKINELLTQSINEENIPLTSLSVNKKQEIYKPISYFFKKPIEIMPNLIPNMDTILKYYP